MYVRLHVEQSRVQTDGEPLPVVELRERRHLRDELLVLAPLADRAAHQDTPASHPHIIRSSASDNELSSSRGESRGAGRGGTGRAHRYESRSMPQSLTRVRAVTVACRGVP